MNIVQISREIPDVGPNTIFTIGGFPIADSFMMSLVVVFILIFLGRAISRRKSLIPASFQNIVEKVYELMFDIIEQVTGSNTAAQKIFPIIGALLVYIGVANLLGLIPGITEIQFGGVSIFRTPTTDFNVTVGLAIAMVILIQIASIRQFGFFGHLGKYFQVREVVQGFRRGVGEGFTAIIGFFVGLLDIVSEFAKVISLSLRLFGNMYAGVVLATIVLGAVAFVLPSIWMGLSLLFAIVQAMVFSALVAAYYTLATTSGENDDS